jgi:type IX secretion system PorP/SprF family membrane protein
MNQSMFNPAYPVVNNVMNFSFMSRVQWAGLNGAPFTNTLLGSTTFFANKGGAGIVLQSNTYGVSTNLEFFAQAAYKITTGHNTQLSIGIQGGYLNYQNDFTKIPEADMDPVFGTVVENISEPNVGMGTFFNSTNFYLGFSIPKFIAYSSNESSFDLLNYQRRYYTSIGGVFPMGVVRLKLSGLAILSDDNNSFDLGASLLMAETIWAGIFTRNFNAYGAIGQIEVTDRLRLGITVELPSTELVANQYGSYEVFVSWEMAALRRQLLKRRYF